MYVDDFLNNALTGKRNTLTLVMTFMLLAILISALGLLAMAIYYTGQQSREIALRKIFGSGVNEAAAKLSKSFIVMTLAAIIIAVPISWWAMNLYLDDFYNRIEFPWWAIPAAALLTCVISFLRDLLPVDRHPDAQGSPRQPGRHPQPAGIASTAVYLTLIELRRSSLPLSIRRRISSPKSVFCQANQARVNL